eukprot:CAMPEP_0194197198 /NCGR_PEP_ID=MMETSP0154-20130528/77076_1 /TAXON_ID=1049557 /ORGANISM="Thalassiothrix antarctica, Strain L6-D1" /LENGTH=315 /DNA_ID=CAMNT_0038921851 /DNA_START=383 /DNA_END=1328 /DNA_ORIENTATION=+
MEENNAIIVKNDNNNNKEVVSSWCDTVQKARRTLDKDLHIRVPCETMSTKAKSAVVVFLTAGKPEGKGSKNVFTASNYVDGILALGAALQDHLTRSDTHKLLLLRDGFKLDKKSEDRVRQIGWIIGNAPNVNEIPDTYRDLNDTGHCNGLSEYSCVLLLDADTLVINNIDDLMGCSILEEKEEYRVAGTLDYYRGKWYHFNTGSALWKPSNTEMNRVYALTKNNTFMKKFQSDQIFTNTVYTDRANRTINNILMDDNIATEEKKKYWGSVADLGWSYNAQTHVEYEKPDFWKKQLEEVKIIHFTQRKGWQCPERH